MELPKIPNIFWYSLSLSVFVFTVGFIYLAWRADGISLSYRDLNIQTQHIGNELQSLEERNDELAQSLQRNEALKSELEEIRAQLAKEKATTAQLNKRLEVYMNEIQREFQISRTDDRWREYKSLQKAVSDHTQKEDDVTEKLSNVSKVLEIETKQTAAASEQLQAQKNRISNYKILNTERFEAIK